MTSATWTFGLRELPDDGRPVIFAFFFTEEGLAAEASFDAPPTDAELGALAAGKDELRTSIANDRATVSPRPGFDVVLHREQDGRWLISLADSVPDEVRTRLGMVAADYEHRQRRGQSTGTVVQ